MSKHLIQTLQATAELYGRQMTDLAAHMFIQDLSGFDPNAVIVALGKCRKELRTFPTVADILARIDDGRPGAEEAWALIPKSEYDSVVWSDEIAEAYGVCRSLIDDDTVAARMAFKEAYTRIVAENRSKGKAPVWTPSLGFEKSGRQAAIQTALEKGRLTQAEAQSLLPDQSFNQVLKQLPAFIKEMPK